MSLKDIKKKASERIELDDLPQRVEAKCVSAVWKQDNNQRECLYVGWITKAGEEFTQKYTPMHLEALGEALVKLKLSSLLDAEFIALKKTTFRIGFPRMIPETT